MSSARQKKDETIGSQTAALREYVAAAGLAVPEQWVFEDNGHSGATLTRPALERLRDLVAGVGVDVVVCYSPDRLARKFAYQALLIEEFTRAGTRVEFVKGPRGDSPEDQLLVQFQGMFAEYEKAQIMERYRRGKAHRARAGSVSVLSGAPYGYRYLRKTPHTPAGYEIVAHEAVLVREVFRRYTDDGASIAELARWLGEQGAPTRTGKTRWDRSVIWGILRNPAYAGQAVYGKTKAINEPAAVNRVARQAGRTSGRAIRVVDRPAEDWVHIPVPAIITTETFERAGQRLADNKRFASRNTKVPSLLQGLAACSGCGYAYYRTSTRTTNKKIYYYRCLGSDDYRYEGGRVCANKPVRADHLDQTVWDHITTLLADPSLIRTEINRRLDTARTSDPVTHQRQRLDRRPDPSRRDGQPDDLRLPGTADHHRRTARPDPRPARPRSQPAHPDRRPRQPTRRPAGLPQARRRPGRLPHRPTPQRRHRRRARTPTRPAPARQRRPRRTRENHHPAPHPRPRTHPHPRTRRPHPRHGG